MEKTYALYKPPRIFVSKNRYNPVRNMLAEVSNIAAGVGFRLLNDAITRKMESKNYQIRRNPYG